MTSGNKHASDIKSFTPLENNHFVVGLIVWVEVILSLKTTEISIIEEVNKLFNLPVEVIVGCSLFDLVA
jgi:hypothetical protein